MERLTAHSKQTSHENGICCTHFCGPECLEVGGNCAMNCKWEEAAWSRLAAYEDTGLKPEEVLPKDKADEIALKLMRLADLESLCSYDRLRKLAEADKDERVVVLPCKIGDKLYRVFAGEIFEHRVGSMKYFAIQGKWDIETYPFCPCVESSIGKTIFLTHEEARKTLEAKK